MPVSFWLIDAEPRPRWWYSRLSQQSHALYSLDELKHVFAEMLWRLRTVVLSLQLACTWVHGPRSQSHCS